MTPNRRDAGPMRGDPNDWRLQVRCAEVDPELWFPESGTSHAAKRVCAGCSVRAECLQFALDNGLQYGIYGGLSVRERRPLHMGRAA